MVKTVLITGAGSGIGRAVAVRMAQDGYDVLLVGRRAAPLEETKALLDSRGVHEVLALDVADRKAFADALDGAMKGDCLLYTSPSPRD